jgi:hypothetical protein
MTAPIKTQAEAPFKELELELELGDTKTVAIKTHAEAPFKEVEFEAAELGQLAIQGHKAASARVAGVAFFIKFEKVEGETEMALEASASAAAEARVAGSGYNSTAAALGFATRALSKSTGFGFAHFGALAGVGKG